MCEYPDCEEHSIICLNGTEWLCWEHYSLAIQAIHKMEQNEHQELGGEG